ncbi:uncharacterized protein LODBEIA_P52570 [Lodderomyces beijingensis]|uniref:TAFII28-like protein domain-containing protein n=1 Tax=Lodderomyces beijingensis TaxID=1775926 RepID=A0ABP0ZSC3_9ASCO
MANTPESEEYESDVSLDEEDEELVWRVFFSHLEKHGDQDIVDEATYTLAHDSEDQPQEAEIDEEEMAMVSDLLRELDDPALTKRFEEARDRGSTDSLNEEEQRRLLIANLTDDQMERFESYRRSTINKSGIKRICNSIVGHSIPQVIATVMAGVTKSFVSEVISTALSLQEREHKAKLLEDIVESKRRKLEAMREPSKAENENENENVKQDRLKYEGDKPTPLNARHIRESWRILQAQSSAASTFDRLHQD